MGRTPYKHNGMPPGLRPRVRRGKTWYYLDKGIQPNGKRLEIPLGDDYLEALRKYADLVKTVSAPPVTVPELLHKWAEDTRTSRARGSQADIDYCVPKLTQFFSSPTPAPIDAVRPVHIAQYLDWRSNPSKPGEEPVRKGAPVRANREVAWLSVAWNWARSRGITDKTNPCEGVRRNKETGRDIYIEDEELVALIEVADEPLREFLQLAHLIGQRPTDMRRLHTAMLGASTLPLQQAKTRTKLRFVIEGDLAALLDHIATRKAQIQKPLADTLLVDENGQPLGKAQLRYRFAKALKLAAEKYPHMAERMATIQMRDIRAKSGTDKREAEGLDAAQGLLGHKRSDMTEHYTRQRKGQVVRPVSGIAERSAKSKKANS